MLSNFDGESFCVGILLGFLVTVLVMMKIIDVHQVGREQILNEEFECAQILEEWHCERK